MTTYMDVTENASTFPVRWRTRGWRYITSTPPKLLTMVLSSWWRAYLQVTFLCGKGHAWSRSLIRQHSFVAPRRPSLCGLGNRPANQSIEERLLHPTCLQTCFLFLKVVHCWIIMVSFLALLDFVSRATVVAQASVVHPSVNSGLSESATWIQAKFCGKLPTCHISRPFCFSFFFIFSSKFSNFYDFFCLR